MAKRFVISIWPLNDNGNLYGEEAEATCKFPWMAEHLARESAKRYNHQYAVCHDDTIVEVYDATGRVI